MARFDSIEGEKFQFWTPGEKYCPAVGLVCPRSVHITARKVFFASGTAIAPKNNRRLRF
jgi:hypothetical protein